MSAILCLKPGSFDFEMISRFQSNPRLAHWQIIKRIFMYHHVILDFVLCYRGRDLPLSGFSDIGWASEHNPPQANIPITSRAVIQCSKKESCIALFTIKSEDIVDSFVSPRFLGPYC